MPVRLVGDRFQSRPPEALADDSQGPHHGAQIGARRATVRPGDPVRVVEHWDQTSTDVNSVTGVTIHEHNRFIVDVDLLEMTLTLSGAVNNAQGRGVGSVIQTTGHKVFEFDPSQDPPLGSLLFNGGPFGGSDEDFCRAIA